MCDLSLGETHSPGLQAQQPLSTQPTLAHSAVLLMTARTGKAASLYSCGTQGPAGACARGLSAWERARAPITPRAAPRRSAGTVGTSARQKARGSRRRRGEPSVRAQPRGKASVGRPGWQCARRRGAWLTKSQEPAASGRISAAGLVGLGQCGGARWGGGLRNHAPAPLISLRLFSLFTLQVAVGSWPRKHAALSGVRQQSL